MEKIGLVLGSGAARGWAHIGVIDALTEAGIEADFVAGCSMGSIVGGAYASGALEQARDTAMNLRWKDVLKYSLEINMPRSGLLDGVRVVKLIEEHLKSHDFSELQKPFQCVACELSTGQSHVFSEGDLVEAIRASISIPGIFTPVYCEGKTLVDGGVCNPVPVDVARDMGAGIVIAVDLNHTLLSRPHSKTPKNMVTELHNFHEEHLIEKPGRIAERLREAIRKIAPEHFGPFKNWLASDPIPNVFDVIVDSIIIMEQAVAARNYLTHPADVLLCPDLSEINAFDFHKGEEAVEIGYRCAMAQMDEIKAALA